MDVLGYSAFSRISALMRESTHVKGPTYVCVKLDGPSEDAVWKLMQEIGLRPSDRVPVKDLHATITYSSAPIENPTDVVSRAMPVSGVGDQFHVFETRDEKRCLVLKLTSLDLRALHVLIKKKFGASHDFPTFEPHVTLCYDMPEGFKVPETKPELHLNFDQFEVKPLED